MSNNSNQIFVEERTDYGLCEARDVCPSCCNNARSSFRNFEHSKETEGEACLRVNYCP